MKETVTLVSEGMSVPMMKELSKQNGSHFFDKSTMQFFNSQIQSGCNGKGFFITSERCDCNYPRLYTVRRMMSNGDVETIGKFQEFKTIKVARQKIIEVIKNEC
jgi:hypothetical protein